MIKSTHTHSIHMPSWSQGPHPFPCYPTPSPSSSPWDFDRTIMILLYRLVGKERGRDCLFLGLTHRAKKGGEEKRRVWRWLGGPRSSPVWYRVLLRRGEDKDKVKQQVPQEDLNKILGDREIAGPYHQVNLVVLPRLLPKRQNRRSPIKIWFIQNPKSTLIRKVKVNFNLPQAERMICCMPSPDVILFIPNSLFLIVILELWLAWPFSRNRGCQSFDQMYSFITYSVVL